MLILLIAFVTAAAFTLLIVRANTPHGRARRFADHDLSGPQKQHAVPVPRVGGIGILAGLAAGTLAVVWQLGTTEAWVALAVLVCGLPAFAAGLVEDMTKAVSPRRRLTATAAAAALAVATADITIRHTTIPGLDWAVSFPIGAAIVTVFVVAGIANSMNLIDGFNGLASMCAILMLMAVAYVGFQVGDTLVLLLALAGVGAVLGFFVWNYPSGLVFLGDGGAYFLGFFVAELSILLLGRNPQVSPLFPLLVCVYPVVETLFSIYRRRVLRDQSPYVPDGIHLHSLIYRRMIRWAVGDRSPEAVTRRNSMTAPYLWILCAASIAPAVLFWDHTAVLAGCIGAFAVFYVVLYWRIVRFRAPRWMVLRP